MPRPIMVTLAVDVMFVIALVGFGLHAIVVHRPGITIAGWFVIAGMGLLHTGVTVCRFADARRIVRQRREFERRYGLDWTEHRHGGLD